MFDGFKVSVVPQFRYLGGVCVKVSLCGVYSLLALPRHGYPGKRQTCGERIAREVDDSAVAVVVYLHGSNGGDHNFVALVVGDFQAEGVEIGGAFFVLVNLDKHNRMH